MSSQIKSILLIGLIFSANFLFGQSNYTELDKITVIPESPKPTFSNYLAGVKNVIIASSPKIQGHLPAFAGLKNFLKDKGFENIEYFTKDMDLKGDINEYAIVSLMFNFDLNEYSNIVLTFQSTDLKYTWTFRAAYTLSIDQYHLEWKFQQLLGGICPEVKPPFNSYQTLKPEYLTTKWTELTLKENFKSSKHDRIEGIYEASTTSYSSFRYKVALRKINNTYYLIYLSGAPSTGWHEGDIKAILEPTATPNFYKAKWYMGNKQANTGFFISFEPGFFNLIPENAEKELYVKLYPSQNNTEVESNSSAYYGTGFAISSNGYVVTNYHVTNGSQNIKVRGVNGDFTKTHPASIVIEDKNNDLAIIKIDNINLGPIPYKISNTIAEPGTAVFVLGYPLRSTMGDEIKLTNGIISSKSGFQNDITSYQISAPVQPGNSGGPTFDDKGNIIGIINAKNTQAENASYSVKSIYLLSIMNQLPKLATSTINTLSNKPLTDKVKTIKNFTYIIEVN